jgi:hypothetical protein
MNKNVKLALLSLVIVSQVSAVGEEPAAQGYAASALKFLKAVATSGQKVVVNGAVVAKDAANATKNAALNAAVVTKNFTLDSFKKETYVNADASFNKTAIAKRAAVVAAVVAAGVVVYKVCKSKNAEQDEEELVSSAS